MVDWRNITPLHRHVMDPSKLSSNELAMLCAMSARNDHWRELVDRMWRPVSLTVLRVARSSGCADVARVDELAQEVFLKLCSDERRLLKQFSPQGPDSIVGYLKVIAANVARDVLRAERRMKRGGSRMHSGGSRMHIGVEVDSLSASPERAGQQDFIERSIQFREIDEALSRSVPEPLSERDRVIFLLYFKQGMTAKDISGVASLGLSIKGVESSIHRTTKLLRSLLQDTQPASAERVIAVQGVHRIKE